MASSSNRNFLEALCCFLELLFLDEADGREYAPAPKLPLPPLLRWANPSFAEDELPCAAAETPTEEILGELTALELEDARDVVEAMPRIAE